MKILKTLGLIVALALAGATPTGAMAQSPFNWTGFYIGVQGGYGFGASEQDETFCYTNPCSGVVLGDRFRANYGLSGVKGGVHAGYNHQLDMVVLGIVTDLNLSRISGNGYYVYYDPAGVAFPGNTDTSRFDFDWEGSTRLLLGVPMDEWMPYLTAGIAYGGGKHTELRTYTVPNPHFVANETLLGVTVGAGLKYGFADNAFITGEVRHTAYGASIVNHDDGTGNTTKARSTISNTAVEVGVSFKF